MRERVDVVVPCYNYARYLPACVDSVLSQQGVDVRVLVIDDASTDNSAEVAANIADRDSRVQVRRHETNRGHIATYNEGLLGWADGDYCALLSADDLLTPGALERAASVMRQRPTVGMVYGRSAYFVTNDELPPTGRHRGTKVWTGLDWIDRRCRSGFSVISSPEVVTRTAVHHRVGGYRPTLPHSGDFEMWLRFAAVSDVAYVRGTAQAFYRRHQQSMLRTQYNTAVADIAQRKAAFEAFFAEHPDIPAAAGLRRAAYLALANDALEQACRAVEHNRVHEQSVDQLVLLARSCVPDVESLTRFRGLQRRLRIGAARCEQTHLYLGAQAARRARSWLWWQSWKLRGT
jgi:glycosyltransferase involved in cell wall biosynthesis